MGTILVTKQLLHDFHSMKKKEKKNKYTIGVNGDQKPSGYEHSSKYLLLCWGEQRNSYRFRTTRGWVNDDSIFIFGWTIPLKSHHTIPGTHIAYYTSHACFIFNYNVHVRHEWLFTRILARMGILTHNCVFECLSSRREE